MVSPRAGRILDLVTLPFLVFYALALIVAGGELAWSSFLLSEGTRVSLEPPDLAGEDVHPPRGLLLLLQAFANLFRDLGMAPAAPGRVAEESSPPGGMA